MSAKERFIEVYKQHIHREGADKFLEYLQSNASDFFEAPASTRFHLSHKGGLCEHSLNVYDCLVSYLNRVNNTYGLQFSEESIALVSLLHDVCKINVYRPGTRNVKRDGKWETVDTFEFDDQLPYGHGEKSVYILSGYMRLTREEAFAIRYHMGFAGTEDERNVGKAFEMFPLAFALSVADMEATYFVEGKQ
ncbi:MAG: HD domain-containing protein [Clostridia bacterium]|nr:HD domain-containing protein [Clostridia bacterium]